MSGDGLIGADRRRAGRHRDAAGHHPRRPRQRPRARARHPDRARGRGRRARRRRRRARSTSARSTASASSASPAVGFDSDANRIANETQLIARQPRLRLRGAAHPGRLEAGPLHGRASTASAARFSGYSVAVANSKAYGGGMFIAPDAELDDGLFDVVTIGEVGKLRFLANLPKVFKGTHVERGRGQRLPRAPSSSSSAEPPLRGLRRRRAPHRPAGDRCGVLPRALQRDRARRRPSGLSGALFGAKRRARARDRRRQPAQRPRRRHDAAGPAAAAARARRDRRASAPASTRGSTIVSATNGKTTTAGMIAAILARRRAASRSTTAPART